MIKVSCWDFMLQNVLLKHLIDSHYLFNFLFNYFLSIKLLIMISSSYKKIVLILLELKLDIILNAVIRPVVSVKSNNIFSIPLFCISY